MREYSAKDPRSAQEIRSDATANRMALIEAAREMFKKRGPEVALSDIIKKAKVSRPTFYRNFKDKRDLVVAIFHYNLELLEQYANEIGLHENTFELMLRAIARQEIEFHALIPFITRNEIELTHRLEQIFEESVNYQKSKGKLRPDFDLKNDLSMLILMLGAASLYRTEEEIDFAIDRACEIIMKGLEPN